CVRGGAGVGYGNGTHGDRDGRGRRAERPAGSRRHWRTDVRDHRHSLLRTRGVRDCPLPKTSERVRTLWNRTLSTQNRKVQKKTSAHGEAEGGCCGSYWFPVHWPQAPS